MEHFAPSGGHVLRTVGEPVGFDRVDDADFDPGAAAGEGGVDPREVVGDHRIFLVPGGLVADRSRVVALGLARHRHPGEVRHADGHAERGLPVAMSLVSLEIEVPVGDAVQFGEDAAAAVLPRGALRLLGGGELISVAEHVDARKLERTVAAHRFAERAGLRFERVLFHHMARKADVVLFAPVADGVGESRGEPLRNMVVVAVAGE